MQALACRLRFESAGNSLLHALDNGGIDLGVGLLQRGDISQSVNGFRPPYFGNDYPL
jgi:hypothetical protein